MHAIIYRRYADLGDVEIRREPLADGADVPRAIWPLALDELRAAVTEDRTRPVATYVDVDHPTITDIDPTGGRPGSRATPCTFGAHTILGLSVRGEAVEGVPVRSSRVEDDEFAGRVVRVADTTTAYVQPWDEETGQLMPGRHMLSTRLDLVDVPKDGGRLRWLVRMYLRGAYPTADDIRGAVREMLGAVRDGELASLERWLAPVPELA